MKDVIEDILGCCEQGTLIDAISHHILSSVTLWSFGFALQCFKMLQIPQMPKNHHESIIALKPSDSLVPPATFLER